MENQLNRTNSYNLITVPYSISKMITDGIFTLDDLIYNEDTLKHLSDNQIISILQEDEELEYCNLTSCGIFQPHSTPERVNRLNGILNVTDKPEIVKAKGRMDGNDIAGQYSERHFKLQSATRKTFAIMKNFDYGSVSYSVPHMVAKMLSGRYGYKVMVNTSSGALYKAMAQ